ncbi:MULTISPECIES: HrpE/YscL family type III secretion apparatus protein [Aeromonas]|uniref:HrpE/YscL family type III secretion apparatus protein n=1 Tax=Aeromonas TaxID=642 RepID=UPI00067EE7B6|nr:HrpE/YscL family type III secretion apparatus protein [Aeromonas schubertii]KUE80867.1 type III secretion system protein [Aeromonas schubertii]
MLPFVQITQGELSLAPELRILRAADYRASLGADELVSAAREEAAAILAEAREIYEQQKQLGWEAGMDEARSRQAALIHETQLQCQQFYRRVEQQMSEVVLESVRKILKEYDQVTLTLQVVREALALVSNQKQVVVRVHPDQAAAVREQIARVHKDFPEISYLEVAADARLDQGGSILETEVGIIDASLDGQLDALSRAIAASFERAAQ